MGKVDDVITQMEAASRRTSLHTYVTNAFDTVLSVIKNGNDLTQISGLGDELYAAYTASDNHYERTLFRPSVIYLLRSLGRTELIERIDKDGEKK